MALGSWINCGPLRRTAIVGFVWYNFSNGVVTNFAVLSLACLWTQNLGFGLLSILSINPGIRLYPMENMETGEGVDSKKRQ
jgi:hypothetical protein